MGWEELVRRGLLEAQNAGSQRRYRASRHRPQEQQELHHRHHHHQQQTVEVDDKENEERVRHQLEMLCEPRHSAYNRASSRVRNHNQQQSPEQQDEGPGIREPGAWMV